MNEALLRTNASSAKESAQSNRLPIAIADAVLLVPVIRDILMPTGMVEDLHIPDYLFPKLRYSPFSWSDILCVAKLCPNQWKKASTHWGNRPDRRCTGNLGMSARRSPYD